MDIAAARTFLAIVDTGSFVSAASSLHITQTAVSARMRVLERVPHAPQFPYSIHAVYATSAEESVIRLIRHGLCTAMGWPGGDGAP